MRPGIAFLLVIGILLGPAYYGYCVFLSGKSGQTIDMNERANRWVTDDGSILRFGNGLAYRPVPLALSPEMNRVILRLRFRFDTDADTSAAEYRYQASLAQLDHTVVERPFTVRAKRGGTPTFDIGPLEITYPAEYAFILEEVGTVKDVPRLSLEIVEKVDTPLRPVIWAGMALLMIALVLTLRDVVRGVQSPPAA